MKSLPLPHLVIAIAFISLFALAVRTPADTDMWWHLRTGQYILETRSLPTTDPFSATMIGTPWIDVHWLSQVILYGAFALSGTAGLAIFVALLAVFAFWFVWKQMEGGVFLRAFILILAAVTAAPVWTPRSQMATFVLTAALSYLLYLYKWKQIDRLWLVPILFVAWVNLHGGYIAGFMLLGMTLVGEAIHALLHVTADEIICWPRLRKLFWITLISGAVLLINPYTIGVVLLPFKTVNIGVLQDFIQEWASPNFHELFLQPMIWMLLLTLGAIGWSGRRFDVTDAAVLSLFAYITFLAQRNIGLFALVCAPILSRHAAALWAKSRWSQRRLSRGLPGLNWLLLILIGLAAALAVVVRLLPAAQAKAEAAQLPVGAVNWIEQHQPAGPLFNSYNWGGYVLWRLWPDYPVYVDGRTDVYDDQFLRNYLAIVSIQPDYAARLERTGAKIVLIEADSPLADFLQRDPNWHVVYRDQLAVIFTRGAA
jgi:hypothetical protein